MRLADELFLVALDDRTGRPRLAPKVLGLGLAGALLAELVLDERLAVHADRLRLLNGRPPADPLARTVVDQLVAEGTAFPVRTWLVYLARRSTQQVAGRLRQAGYLTVVTARRLMRRETWYPPVDANVAFAPTARLAYALRTGRQVTWQDAALAGMVAATGLEPVVLHTGDAAAREYLQHLVSHLSTSLHALVWQVHAAVGDAVLTGRT